MSHAILWMDRENAKLFNLENSRVTHRVLHAHEPDHHTHHRDQDEKTSAHFLKTIFENVKDFKKIVILGPGLAKKHFTAYLGEHHPDFVKRIAACITVDHPTDGQMMEYFKVMHDHLDPAKV